MRTGTIGALLLSATFWAGTATAQDINTMVGPRTFNTLGTGTEIGSFGDAWVGQTFTVPAVQAFLSTVTFQVGLNFFPSTTNVVATLVIREWSSAGAPTGSTIFSDSVPTPTGLGTDTTSQATFNVSMFLTPGELYVAYIEATTSPYTVGDTWTMSMWADTYSGGFAVAKYASETNWRTMSSDPINFDMGFKADFETSPIPEPATVVLLGTGLIGMAGWGVRRRRNL